MKNEDIKVAKKLLSSPKKILIIPHKNPDGDAMGSCLGLAHYLESQGHQALVIAPNDYPDFLKWLPGTEQVLIYENQKELSTEKIGAADLCFSLDFNAMDRIGDLGPAIQKHFNGDHIMIDHHQQPADYALITYSDVTMSSTCEMVYHFIDALGHEDLISENTANCLYTGIMTDTGSFRFPSTTSTTHRVVASLMDKGAANSDIHNRVYDANSPERLQLLGRALSNLTALEEYHTAYITLTSEELEKHKFKKGDTEGFVNYGLSLKGIRFAVIFIENAQEGIIKISLRSKGDFSVNDFARSHFSGGGHINAAGGRSEMNMQATIEKFVNLLPQYKDQLTK
ncbi:DHH family phosphoesterase [Robertkochia sediminum]|uniref:DHH family phosphoesterase n=1 Tax=Robertkochia sediminum TaxID=2785326 RepID=UPI001933F83D|nr:bifunctional oligoribonuclease/PAP phosphatase NrnA [Robertkochia sediminum]MBL7472152.1 bifunctional oligoribonuclease/PAP phosphatase NrnA [Robertkochia sediminum]